MKKHCDFCGCERDFKELEGEGEAALWENSHAVLRGNSHAVLWENSHAVLWGNSHAQCLSPYACAILKTITADATGRLVGNKPIAPDDYLSACGIPIKRGTAILYKSVNGELKNGRDGTFQYTIGKECSAPDWNGESTEECGKGLHLSPSPAQAASFFKHGKNGVFLACRVRVEDIASLPAYARYPDKIRVRACKPLYICDENGKKLEVK